MLIATDLDGTFLSPDATVSPRNRAAVEAAEAAGIRVVPVTGRAIGGLRIIGPVFHQHSLVCNGAVGVNMSTGETLFTATMPVHTVKSYVDQVTAELPGTVFCAEVGDSSVFLVEKGYDDIVPAFESENDPAEHVRVSREELCSTEAVKLMVVHPTVPAQEMLQWAGTSYAMGGAQPEAIAAADRRAPSCQEDGFAVVVEELLASR